jgi:hypothetical protein
MDFPDPVGVIECSHEDIIATLRTYWPAFYTVRERREDDFVPLVDGHWRVGFSLRLFGPSGLNDSYAPDPSYPARRQAAWVAMEQMQRAMEDAGLETTRDGNRWQDGRLILGWAAVETSTGLVRVIDLPEGHPAILERRDRLARERAERDGKAE